jgi:hypothetical protein
LYVARSVNCGWFEVSGCIIQNSTCPPGGRMYHNMIQDDFIIQETLGIYKIGPICVIEIYRIMRAKPVIIVNVNNNI